MALFYDRKDKNGFWWTCLTSTISELVGPGGTRDGTVRYMVSKLKRPESEFPAYLTATPTVLFHFRMILMGSHAKEALTDQKGDWKVLEQDEYGTGWLLN